jgi:hypothetical protein
MRCPDTITEVVTDFAHSIVAGSAPVYISCTPLKGKPALECFPIVAEHIASQGGFRELGWSIYMWPDVFIEAELHAVWVSPEGERRDIAPHQIPMKRILFLPDPTATYGETHQVLNRRRALKDDPLVHRFIAAAEGIYREENRGELAKLPYFVSTPKWRELQKEKMTVEIALIQKYGPPPGTPAIAALLSKFLPKNPFA